MVPVEEVCIDIDVRMHFAQANEQTTDLTFW